MLKPLTPRVFSVALVSAFLLIASAQEKPASTGDKPKEESKDAKTPPKKDPKDPKDELVESAHSVTVNGNEIKYTATTGTIVMKEEDGKARASFFFVAYIREGVTNLSARPLTFSFNGGPGSASVWLHLGILGPRRVRMNDDGTPPPPPYSLVDNEYSLLDQTDLVFIDPISTGFSRAVPGEDPKRFHGVDGDIKSVGEFIRLYTTRYKRWLSPKFLIGESYGTTRAAGLSGHLQEALGMNLNGIMLVSAVLDFQTISFNPGNDLPYIVFLPTYTASAWYHKKLPADLQRDLQQTLKQSEQFAMNDYTVALAKGDSLTGSERTRIIQQVARFTGLSTNFVYKSKLRINIFNFAKELLRDQDKTVGRFDSRYTGLDRDGVGDTFDYDPSYAAVQGPYTAALNDYVRRELKYESDLPYEVLTGNVRPWNYGEYQNRYLNVAETLRRSITQNPHLKVMVANGYYDLATPYLATDYTFNHLILDPSLRGNITMTYYEAGHMMYSHKPSLVKLKKDLAAFIESALPK